MADQATFASGEELELIRATARQFLDDRLSLEVVRKLMMSPDGFDAGLWREFGELGWLGLALPEEYGGAGYGMVELGVLLEEMGRVVTPGPFFANTVLAATAIEQAATDEQKTALLPVLAGGESIATLAVFEKARNWDPASIETRATLDGGDWVLEGTKRYVLDAHLADMLVVSARIDDGLGLFAIDADEPGVEVSQVPTLDATRRQADVVLEAVRVGSSALLGGGPSDGALANTLAVGSAALACEQVGGAQQCLDMSVEHAKSRYQFGRPIGSFQAIKHRCAEMLVRLENAKSTARHAVRVLDDPQELAVASPLAASVCSEAYLWIAGETIQVHGGIGFTWEHDAHLYLKRAKSSSLLLGDPRYQRDLLGRAIGI